MEKSVFKSYDGKELACYLYESKNPNKVIQIAHGMQEYSRTYFEFAEFLQSKGYTVFLFDQRGHGKSVQDKTELEIIDSLSKSSSSVFEVRRVLSNGFELYNLVNEKMYKVLSLVKMNNFRGITPGQFALCRIFPMNNEYYLLEVSNVLSSINKDEVYKYAIAKIIEKPEDAYEENPKKLEQIETIVKDFGKKWNKFLQDNPDLSE